MLKSFAKSFAKKRELRKTFAGSHVGSFWVKLTLTKLYFIQSNLQQFRQGGSWTEVFCHETGLAVLRVLALTRNTYKNPNKALQYLVAMSGGEVRSR